MLFNSYIFISLFLPITLTGFYLIGGQGHHRAATGWLVCASLFFYGWWNPAYLGLILGSVLFNYAVGVLLGNRDAKNLQVILALGIGGNLGLIGYFKYANFFVDNINLSFGSDFHLETIILPLAISFFTFQQIAYLVDAYRGETKEYNFLHYCLFVTFFPQLIAGPIVHHKEMLPQFAKDVIYRLKHENIAIGIAIFVLGLFKKVVLADQVAVYATPVFNAAEQGLDLTFFEAWSGALAYTLQLYFDFSGYSDMAIGLARMFGIVLPLNFHSPYKALNITEFWRHWHMTLSRFLRNYLYIPLGGNRRGQTQRYINLMITMILGGLWHGAGWTFVAWGALHGFYLIVHHGWRAFRKAINQDLNRRSRLGRGTARIVTFTAVVVGWVFFRAGSFDGAISILAAMSGANGISLPGALESRLAPFLPWITRQGIVFDGAFSNGLADFKLGIILIALLLLIAWFAPNTQQIMTAYRPALDIDRKELQGTQNWLQWKPNSAWAVATGLIFATTIFLLGSPSEFLYFQF